VCKVWIAWKDGRKGFHSFMFCNSFRISELVISKIKNINNIFLVIICIGIVGTPHASCLPVHLLARQRQRYVQIPDSASENRNCWM